MNSDQAINNQDGSLSGAGLVSYLVVVGVGLAVSFAIATRAMF